MKNFIIGIFFGAVLLVAAIWYYGDRDARTGVVKKDLQNAAADTRELVAEKLSMTNINGETMKDELKRTGQVVREKAQAAGNAVANAATDAKITTTIKAKLLGDTRLASLKISVSTTDGVVTLSGTASSLDHVRKAMELALDTDGVHRVVSTIQVKE